MMEAIKALVIILGFAILAAALVGIWLSIGVLGVAFAFNWGGVHVLSEVARGIDQMISRGLEESSKEDDEAREEKEQ